MRSTKINIEPQPPPSLWIGHRAAPWVWSKADTQTHPGASWGYRSRLSWIWQESPECSKGDPKLTFLSWNEAANKMTQGRGVEFCTQLMAPFSCEHFCTGNIHSPTTPIIYARSPGIWVGLSGLINENRRTKWSGKWTLLPQRGEDLEHRRKTNSKSSQSIHDYKSYKSIN